jgi:hypothetical protein
MKPTGWREVLELLANRRDQRTVSAEAPAFRDGVWCAAKLPTLGSRSSGPPPIARGESSRPLCLPIAFTLRSIQTFSVMT